MKIRISYQPQQLPPPYAYAAVLVVETEKMNAQFELEYLGRDVVSDDELRAEGFTRDDDFQWSGHLDQKWKKDIEGLTTMDMDSNPDADIYAHVDLNGKALGFPRNINHADLIFQEVLQSILELAGLEMPLTSLCLISNKKYDLTWNFSKRTIDVNTNESEKWEDGREVIKLIYDSDFDSFQYSKKPTDPSVNPGDGRWYHVPKKYAAELKSLIERL